MKYFIKQCGHQELGSVGSDGRPKRGRYLLISMDSGILGFFPPLSETQLNDFVAVACEPLYLKNKKIYCNFVYHNDKFHGSHAIHPRNEYRLYLNKDLEGGRLLFQEGDFIIFRKSNEDQPSSGLFIDRITVGDENYSFCKKTIDESPIRGGYAIFEGSIPAFESKVPSSPDEHDVAIDPNLINLYDKTPLSASAASLFSPIMFRDFLLFGYEGLCAVTRSVIRYENLMNIEAAHLRPKAHGGTFLPSNGFMLSRDLHWAFDKGFFSISDDFEIIIHPDVKSEFLRQYDKKKLFIPNDVFFRPAADNIMWHRTKIFGLFKQSGAIRGADVNECD